MIDDQWTRYIDKYHALPDNPDATSLKLRENWCRQQEALMEQDRLGWVMMLAWVGIPGAALMANFVWIPLIFG